MSSAFLDRFKSKISTTTSEGHFKTASGEKEVRVGPKRRSNNIAKTTAKNVLKSNNNSVADNNTEEHSTYNTHSQPANNGKKRAVPRRQSRSAPTESSPAIFRPMSYQQTGMDATTVSVAACRRPESIRSVQSRERTSRRLANLNESKNDRLAFSKKARPVSYSPYSLSDYKRDVAPGTYVELGKLKPDLNDAALVAKRANKERIKAFSAQLRKVNQETQEETNAARRSNLTTMTTTTTTAPPPQETISAREKALEFAKRVPKPRVIVPPSVSQCNKPIKKVVSMNHLEELQAKRRLIKAQVEAIRRDINSK